MALPDVAGAAAPAARGDRWASARPPAPPAPRPDRPGARVLRTAGLGASAALLTAVVLLSLRVGSLPLPTDTVLEALTSPDGSREHLVVRTLRLPRTVVGVAVGAGLAVSGVALQAVTRNPLASPEILGMNAGAAAAVVVAVHLLGVVTPGMYVWFAFAGALAATVLVVSLASAGRGGATPVRLALAGAAVTALLASWVSAVLVLDRRTLDEVRFWLAGSLVGRDLADVMAVAPFLLAGLLTLLAMARQFDTLALGDSVAAGLGQRAGQVRAGTFLAVVLVAGAAVSVAGPVGFVGLAVPHAVRSLVGPAHRWLLPYCLLLGPALVLAADVLGRAVARPGEIPVGIMTAVLGAPVLVHLVRRRHLGDW